MKQKNTEKTAKNEIKTTKIPEKSQKQQKSAKDEQKTVDFISQIKNCFDEESKIEVVDYSIAQNNVSVFFIECLIDKKMLSSAILSPLKKLNLSSGEQNKDFASLVKNTISSVGSVTETTEKQQVLDAILSGSAVVVMSDKAYSCSVFSAEKRSPEEPPTSRVIKGPREGFVEDIYTNLGLVRKRIKSQDLKQKEVFIGKRTNTRVTLVYLKGIAKQNIVDEVEKRLKSVDIDGVIDSYYVEQFLEADNLKFVRRVGNTEKPDIFCAKILEGRVGIIVDGSPIALTVPFILFEDLQSSEDYYTIPAMATFGRIMRLCGLIFAMIIPGIYVALQSFNYRILPINFLISLLSSIEGLSIPPLIEILVVLLLFEVITEASLQMPNSLGMALSIIGALALGNTAVDAGIISPPSIVVVAVSSVALYIIPDQISETRLLRIIFTLAGGIIGLYGLMTSFMILMAYLSSIRSFGVPFFMPYAPSVKEDKKDGFIKKDLQSMRTRPKLISGKNNIRQRINSQSGKDIIQKGNTKGGYQWQLDNFT